MLFEVSKLTKFPALLNTSQRLMPSGDGGLNERVLCVLTRLVPLIESGASDSTLFPVFSQCLEGIIGDHEVRRELFGEKCRVLFGRTVNALLLVFDSKTRDKQMRAKAGFFLGNLFDPLMPDSTSGSIAYILPGVVLKCASVVKNEPESQFVCIALDVITKIICSTLNDELVKQIRGSPMIDSAGELSLKRDEKFVETAVSNITPMLQKLISLTAVSSNEKDRLKLLDMFDFIDENCHETFANTPFQMLRLQLAVRFSADKWPQIQKSSHYIIQKLSKEIPEKFFEQCKTSVRCGLTDIIEKRANSLDAFQLTSHFMSVLSPSQFKILAKGGRNTKSLCSQCRKAFDISVDIDLSKISVSDDDIFSSLPLKETTKKEYIEGITSAFVKNGMGKAVLRSHLNALLSRPNSKRLTPAIILMFTSKAICDNAEKYSHAESFLRNVIRSLGKLLNRLDSWESQPTDSSGVESSSLDNCRESAEANALLICIGYLMRSMKTKSRHYHRLILDVLYTVLQYLPSTNFACATSAQWAVGMMAKAFDQTVEQFLGMNADKVVFKAAMMSKKLHENPRSPLVLAALLNKGMGKEMVDQLRHLIPDLVSGIDSNDGLRIVPSLKAMNAFILALSHWFPEIRPNIPEREEYPSETADADVVSTESSEEEENEAEDGSDWKRLEKIREKFERLQKNREKEMDENMYGSAVPSDYKEPPPPLIQCVQKIVERTQHLQHSEHPYTRLQLLDLLSNGLRFIRHFPDELLPMIHQNWVPMSISIRRVFSRRSKDLSSPDKLIVAAELRVIAVMSELSGSFVQRKISEELETPLGEYLTDIAALSRRTAKIYSQSAAFKLQKSALECWPLYCRMSKLPTEKALRVLELYETDSHQNADLRQIAQKSLEELRAIEVPAE